MIDVTREKLDRWTARWDSAIADMKARADAPRGADDGLFPFTAAPPGFEQGYEQGARAVLADLRLWLSGNLFFEDEHPGEGIRV